MLISPRELKKFFGICPERVLHIGAHLAEELENYVQEGWGLSGTFWIESNPFIFQKLKNRLKTSPQNTAIFALVWSVKNTKKIFNISNNTESSSVFEFGDHKSKYPQIFYQNKIELTTTTIEDIWNEFEFERIDLINLDIQGAELQALIGASDKLKLIKYVYSEINLIEMYKDCTLFRDFDKWLSSHNFTLIDWEINNDGWGDAVWVNNNYLMRYFRVRRFLRIFFKFINFYYSKLKLDRVFKIKFF